jgi:DNA repair photolyase
MKSSPRLRERRIWNPPNPYLTEHRELLGEAPVAELEVYEDRSRSVLSQNDSPDVGFRWSVNPYRGCFHACAYCYARPTHEYLGLGSGTDFERKIYVKPEAPALLEAAFRKRSWKGELVAFSGVTDCYQPLEAAWNLTRGCLEVCEAFHNPVGIITKSILIKRDKELLRRLAGKSLVNVSISIPFLDEEIARKLEPGTPSIERRFDALRELSKVGVPVGIAVAPIIPGLNDFEIPALLRRAKECGATFASRILLRLPGNVREVFFRRLEEELPLRSSRVERRILEVRGGKLSESRFGKRHRGEGIYWETIDRVWKVWVRRLGLEANEDERAGAQLAPRRSRAAEKAQLELPL